MAVLNARTDVFWNPEGRPDERLGLALDRLERYRASGATCLFVPGIQRTGNELGSVADLVGELVGACRGVPVNLLASRDLGLGLDELAALGVRRISFGSSLCRAALARALAIVEDTTAGHGWDTLRGGRRAPLRPAGRAHVRERRVTTALVRPRAARSRRPADRPRAVATSRRPGASRPSGVPTRADRARAAAPTSGARTARSR